MTAPILILCQARHDGRVLPPAIHARPRTVEQTTDTIRHWCAAYAGAGYAVLQDGEQWSAVDDAGRALRVVATLWIEWPVEMMAPRLPGWLDARWRGPVAGAAWDTRDGARGRVGR